MQLSKEHIENSNFEDEEECEEEYSFSFPTFLI